MLSFAWGKIGNWIILNILIYFGVPFDRYYLGNLVGQYGAF